MGDKDLLRCFIENTSPGEDVTRNADERDLDDGLGK